MDFDNSTKFKHLVENSFCGICVVDKNNVLFVNSTFSAFYGYTYQEFSKIGFREIVSNIEYSEIERILNNDKIERNIFFGKHVLKDVTKNGDVIFLDIVYKKILWDGKDAIIINAIDVTKQTELEKKIRLTLREAEMQILEHNKLLKLINENVPVGIWRLDRNGNLIDCNKFFCNFFGRKKEELFGKRFYRYISTIDGKDVSMISYDEMANCDQDIHEIELVDSLGRIKYGSVIYNSIESGIFSGTIGVLFDDTAKKQIVPELLKIKNNMIGTSSDIV